MKAMRVKAFLALLIIALIYPSSLSAATEQRIALIIGNGAYSSSPLKNPVNDATDMATALQRLRFKVNLKKNADLQTMEEAIEDFGNRLKKGGVGLFYYAGHGVQVNGTNYLIPVNAKINKESDIRFKAVDVGLILAEMENASNGMNIILLDACRDNPFGKSSRSASRGLAIVSNSPSGTFISYSTSPGQIAKDGEGRNSPYTKALLENIAKPGLTINSVFMKVRSKVKKETGQVPWELSSLEGDFFFAPRAGNAATMLDDSSPVKSSAKDVLDDDNRKREVEQRPLVSIGNEIRRDDRFIAYDNDTVLDTKTSLMWAAMDNGSDIDWDRAKYYCGYYRGGGYTDWRMPTQDELAGLYDSNKSRPSVCSPDIKIHVATELINITCFVQWTSNQLGTGTGAENFGFYGNLRGFGNRSANNSYRVLPVRSAK
jgi:hypothetical protein